MDEIKQIVAATLWNLIEDSGWRPPITIALTGEIDGRSRALRVQFDGGGTSGANATIAEIQEDVLAGFDLRAPLSVVFVNLDDEVVVVTFEKEGAEPRFIKSRSRSVH